MFCYYKQKWKHPIWLMYLPLYWCSFIEKMCFHKKLFISSDHTKRLCQIDSCRFLEVFFSWYAKIQIKHADGKAARDTVCLLNVIVIKPAHDSTGNITTILKCAISWERVTHVFPALVSNSFSILFYSVYSIILLYTDYTWF